MQYQFDNIADEILKEIRNNTIPNNDYGVEFEDGEQRYSNETIEKFKDAYIQCKKAGVYAQRVDWLVSGDDGEDSFHRRLYEDLEFLQSEIMELGAKNWYIGIKEDIDE